MFYWMCDRLAIAKKKETCGTYNCPQGECHYSCGKTRHFESPRRVVGEHPQGDAVCSENQASERKHLHRLCAHGGRRVEAGPKRPGLGHPNDERLNLSSSRPTSTLTLPYLIKTYTPKPLTLNRRKGGAGGGRQFPPPVAFLVRMPLHRVHLHIHRFLKLPCRAYNEFWFRCLRVFGVGLKNYGGWTKSCMTLRTLNYGNYGIFLIMGHAVPFDHCLCGDPKP